MPNAPASGFCAGNSSWSVASISASNEIVSIAGPLKRVGSTRLAFPSPPVSCV
jgi:hypothetical protein